MPSDTPTTEAGRSLVDHYRRGLTFPMEWTEMLVRVRGIEAEAAEKAVRSFAERARREVERLPWNPDDGSVPFDGGEWAVGEYRSAVLALLQAETPDASDSGEGGTCPGPDCPYCAGEMCARFDGLGCTHDVIERHGYREPRP
jgi:hypothetical protein